MLDILYSRFQRILQRNRIPQLMNLNIGVGVNTSSYTR